MYRSERLDPPKTLRSQHGCNVADSSGYGLLLHAVLRRKAATSTLIGRHSYFSFIDEYFT